MDCNFPAILSEIPNLSTTMTQQTQHSKRQTKKKQAKKQTRNKKNNPARELRIKVVARQMMNYLALWIMIFVGTIIKFMLRSFNLCDCVCHKFFVAVAHRLCSSGLSRIFIFSFFFIVLCCFFFVVAVFAVIVLFDLYIISIYFSF